MRKFLSAVVLIPLGIVLVLFAVANREVVTLTFDPFDRAQPAFALRMPLFLLSFVLVGIGVLIGGFVTWVRQRRWRARAREAEREVRLLREQLSARRWPQDEARQAQLADPPRPAAPLSLPPAA
jgi:uncharacterized integral membrane protein